jgi:DNA-directed RNA polymerase subunit M/transcription elongation factor TFIIS
MKFRSDIEVDLDPNVRWCPRPGCQTIVKKSIVSPKDKTVCTKCQFEMCFKCGEIWHTGNCNQNSQALADIKVNDDEYLAWAKQQEGTCTNCPKCNARI